MDTIEAISKRRSIRKYSTKEISRDIILKVIQAASQAPSAKNRQPWRFVVVTAKAKDAMMEVMRKGIEHEKSGKGLLPCSTQSIVGAEYTMDVMKQAPVTVLILNTHKLAKTVTREDEFYNLTNIQSIGAAIQNMILSATDLGLGSLWICDIYFAYEQLTGWLNTDDQLVAAISLGYPAEKPFPRPRKNIADLIEWREQENCE